MNNELHDYIARARGSGDGHETVRDRLVGAGWHPDTVEKALDRHQDQAQPGSTPQEAAAQFVPADGGNPQNEPIGVVQVYSTRGAEYFIMLVAMSVSALSMGILLASIAEHLFGGSSGAFDTGIMAFTTSSLVVGLPILAWLFLRLKKAELANPRLRLDPSRRRMVQIALLVSFVVGFFSLIGFLSALSAAIYGGKGYEIENIGVLVANMVIVLGIAGGIFAYFWLDSHRKAER
ncbi:MAG: DUF5671 domain-containing protein [Candidatus Saccharimonadales bacterium]